MPWTAFTRIEAFLGQAAQQYFSRLYEGPSIKIGEEVDRTLSWRPTFHFKANDYLIIAAEASETPYPAIFRLSHANVSNSHIPIAIYCICREDVYLDKNKQDEIKELEAHGYGLYTVDEKEIVQRRIECIPLIQHIPTMEFHEEISKFPPKYRIRLKDCYKSYNNKPVSGLQEITEMVEGLINKAANKAVKKGLLSKINKSTALILDDMIKEPKFNKAIAGIGGLRSYIKEYRNIAHHDPKNRAQAYKKYRACRHGLIEGIRQMQSFRKAMKDVNIFI